MSAEPAFHGFIENTFDALLLFEACRRGDIPKITRRLQEFEKKAMVMSGAIFVFDEEETGIKRWTDGLSWSPSRTLGNFLVYRELDKKSSSKNSIDHSQGTMMNSNSAYQQDEDDQLHSPGSQTISPRKRSLSDASGTVNKTRERALVGSLTSTFRFRSDGLVKKTISLAGLHLIGYYRIEDVTAGHLRTPSSHVELSSLQIASCFLSPTLFRVPPLVDLGSDGQLRYKGEMDPLASPLLHSRSGSSQGFGTPLMPPMHTGRTRSNSPPAPIIQQRESVTSSPNRRAAHRTNRYEPYNGARLSPPIMSGFPTYPFPVPNQQQQYSPNGGAYPSVLPREDYYPPPSRESGLSPAMAGLGSGTMNPNWGSGPQSTTLSRSAMVEQVYHPRQAAPFAPNESNHNQNATSSESFAFRAPSRPSPLISNSPTPSYESYSAPSMSTQYSSSSNSSRYAPPPSYSQHGRPYGHQSQHSGSSTYSVGSSYRDYSHLPAVSPRHSPQEYSVLSQSSYPNSNRSSITSNPNSTKPPGYPSSPPQQHLQQQQQHLHPSQQQLQQQQEQHHLQQLQQQQHQQPNGMVMGAMEGPEQRLGLGLQGIRGKIPSLDNNGRPRERRSGELGFSSYETVGLEGGEEDTTTLIRRDEKVLSSNNNNLGIIEGGGGGGKEQYWDSHIGGWQLGKEGYNEKRRSH